MAIQEDARLEQRVETTGHPSREKETVMAFFAQNWFYIVILALFVAMHLFGFGCGHARQGDKSDNASLNSRAGIGSGSDSLKKSRRS